MISILMPVFNTAPYLAQCLNSIRSQTFTDWELIAIDDFSTDSSATILDQFAQLDPRISWYGNDKKGIIPALEKAFLHSRGELIHRMDSDDLMPTTKLELLHQKLESSGSGTVVTGMVRYFSSSLRIRRGYRDYERWINKQVRNDTIYDDIYTECPIASPAWLMSRNDLKRIGGITQGRYPEDYDLVFRMFVHGLKSRGVPNVVHFWRDWSSRASRTKKEYADQLFFDLKIYYFMQYHYDSERPLALWGAGRKGKKLMKKMVKWLQPNFWITENPKKIGHRIYGILLTSARDVISTDAQIIVAVSNPVEKRKIRQQFRTHDRRNHLDYFFFC